MYNLSALNIIKNKGMIVFPVDLKKDPNNPTKKLFLGYPGWDKLTKSVPITRDYGIQCGERSNVIGIDLDVFEDKTLDGVESWDQLVFMNSPDPNGIKETFAVRTGSGGVHMYFKWTDKLLNQALNGAFKIFLEDGSVKKLKIDIKGEGGLLFGPGTWHPVAEKYYELMNDVEIQEMPDWLIDLLNHGELDHNYKRRDKTSKVSKPINTQFINKPEEKAVKPCGKEYTPKERKKIYNDLKELLEILPEEYYERQSYDEWVRCGMIIYNKLTEVGLKDHVALNLWKEFSELYPNYDEDRIDEKWLTFSNDCNKKLGFTALKQLCIDYNPEGFEEWQEINKERWIKEHKEEKQEYVSSIIGEMEDFTKAKLDNPIVNLIEYQNQGLITDRAYARSYWVKLFWEAKDSKDRQTVMKRFMKHFVVCTIRGERTLFYINYDALDNLVWEECPLHRTEASFHDIVVKEDKQTDKLFNSTFAIQADLITMDPIQPILYQRKEFTCFNRYIAPPWTLEKLEDWYKAKGIEADREKAFKTIEYHLKEVICNNKEEDFKWLYNWIGSTLYEPNFSPKCCPILKCDNTGTGKSTFIRLIFQNYMGSAFCSKDDNKYLGNGALTSTIGKTFCLLDEFHIESVTEYNKWKTFITEPTITYEQKYIDAREVKNIIKCIATTNQPKPIQPLITNERRAVIFHLDSQKTMGANYFQDLYNHTWQYYPLYFKDYNTIAKFDGYKTEDNKIQADISLTPIKHFIRGYVIGKYNQIEQYKNSVANNWISSASLNKAYKAYNNERWLSGDLKNEVSFNTALFHSQLKDNGVIEDTKTVRVTYNGKNKEEYGKQPYSLKLKSRAYIIQYFKDTNSQLDPIVDDCLCGEAKGSFYCKDHDVILCEKCKERDHDNHKVNEL
jgi:hypothetical protein